MATNKYSAKQAAIAVLKKAEELYNASTLAKGEMKKEMGAPMPPAAPSPAGAAQPMQKMGMSEAPEGAPMEKMGMSEAPMKGHIKLAKFVGRMEHKKGEKAKEMDKGEDPLSSVAGDRMKRAEGYKERGDKANQEIAVAGAKDAHKERLQNIQQAPKPKLGKGM